MLLYGLTAPEASALVAQGWLSTPRISINFHPLAPQLHRLMFSLGGVINKTVNDVRVMVIKTMCADTVWPGLLDIATQDPSGQVSAATARKALRKVIKSVRVTSTPMLGPQASDAPIYNVFMDVIRPSPGSTVPTLARIRSSSVARIASSP